MTYQTILRSAVLAFSTPFLTALLAAPASAVSTDGEGYLGISITEADGGVRVDEVYPETAAAQAGLQSGDVLLAVEGQSVGDFGDLRDFLSGHHPGDSLAVRIRRGDEERELPLVLGERPEARAEEHEERQELQEHEERQEHEHQEHEHQEHGHHEHEHQEARKRRNVWIERGHHEPRFRLEEEDEGDGPRVFVWRGDEDAPFFQEEEDEDGSDAFFGDRESFEERLEAALDEYLEGLRGRLDQGREHRSERLHELRERGSDESRGNAWRQHPDHRGRGVERWYEDRGDLGEESHGHRRRFAWPREELRFGDEEHGPAFELRRRDSRFGSQAEMAELRDSVSQLRDEIRGLRDELRALREELRR